ncbi:MAG: sensor signal transduction histidine kinase [Rhodoferax sp.]|nr:sensor signal transduction histidine kinase [Rhodoferax sp.]
MSEAVPPSPETIDLVDDAPCALARTSTNGTFMRVNATLCGWLGYSADELVGKRKVQDLLSMGGKIFHQTHWAPLLQMQGSVSEVRLELIHKDGSRVPMIMNAVRRERAGAVVHDLAAFVARDRDKFEQELVASRKRLEAAIEEATGLQEEAKDRALFAEQMMAIVSHDLRTPLATILMSAQVLGRRAPSADQLRVLERISRAASRANRMVSDLLDFTRARLGKGLAVERRRLNPHSAVADSVEELTSACPGRDLQHVREGSGHGLFDVDRLAQLVVNLVTNAVAYGDASRPVIVTSTARADSFSVSVLNFGTPIPAEAMPSLFEPMVRGHGHSNGGRSVGLGLYIVSEIAKAHGGSVEVSSDEVSGTQFTAHFPG